MRLSQQTLVMLARNGDIQAATALSQYDLEQGPDTEAYYLGETDVYLIHTPQTLGHLPKRPWTLVGMPAVTSSVIITDDDGEID
jgi:hypothetical protein